MKVDFETRLVDLSGTAINDSEGKPAALRGVVIDALLAQFKDEPNLSGEEKVKRFILAEKIFRGETEVSAEDVSLIKKLIGKAYNPLIVGQAWQILEGK